jgi:predicted negative regulator of RcsB-dependent stress response
MTSPKVILDEETPLADLLAQWFRGNTRLVLGAAAIVVVVGGGYVLWGKNLELKARNAERQLLSAKMAMRSANPALAVTEFQRVVERYGGTPAGGEGAMMLAGLLYEQGKYGEGVAALEAAAGKVPGPMVAALKSLIADGYLEMNRPADALRWYEDAAASARYGGEKAAIQARAARAATAAGQADRAKALWTSLRDNQENPSAAAEARVRLGELTAAPAGGSAPTPGRGRI